MRFEKHQVLRNCRAASLWGLLLDHKRSDGMLASRREEGRRIWCILAPLSQSLHLVLWTGVTRQGWGQTRERSWEAVGPKRVWRAASLTGLHAQPLPVWWLVWLWIGAGVRSAIEGWHGAPFTVCVQAAVGRVVCLMLSVPLRLLQSSNLLLQQCVLLL